MTDILHLSIYILIGACWANIAEERVFKPEGMTTIHKLLAIALWPLDIVLEGITR